MPVSVHKILCHGTEVIKQCIIPIGQLSQEAQKARKKDCRRFRMVNIRKTSRISTNRHLLNMLLISSDPLINSFSKKPLTKRKLMCPEILQYLIFSRVNVQESDTSTQSSSGSDRDSF